MLSNLQRAADQLGGRAWGVKVDGGSLHERLRYFVEKAGGPDEPFKKRTFLLYLARWVVVRLDQLRRSKSLAGSDTEGSTEEDSKQ